jgi:hypothetical protein
MKISLEIKINAYTTLSFSSDITNINNTAHQLLLKVPQGPSLKLINRGMECQMEFPGKQFIPGKIENAVAHDEGAVLTIGCKKTIPALQEAEVNPLTSLDYGIGV